MALKIGYKASAEQFGPRDLVEYSVLAEQVGLDSVMVSDHFQPWRHQGGHAPFSFAWMAAVGERTERVVLGTSVLTATFRYNPAVVAQAFGTLGSLYPGRVLLGVGSGEALNEVAVARIEWPAFKERFARLREAIDLMRKLWSEERVTFEGEYFQTTDATVYDRPEGGVPIYIAAGGPVMAKYVGKQGDGFICTSGKGMELYTEKLLPAVAEGAEQVGRSTGDIDKMIEIKLSYDPDPAQALENTRFWAPLSLTPEQKAGIEDPAEMEKAADALPIEQVARRWIVTSDPADAVEQIKPYVEAGFNHLVFHGPGHDQERFLRSFSEQVVPGLRELA
ncbi:F420-dependent oxidoreductase [Amycolatopsis sp. MJM2582]|uniref:F420-dependent glucose-6-phosphate dehydrogenase n=2 Tax=Amycolatopsis japonica group TaxID=2893673 RepID=A0A075V481_9PSEU|nr:MULTISPECIES: glucose-6-phosphate dehydrogenase (coenzyme-F420) [Amycolatopsis]AIG77615.1 F420-dependent glucose-6-phosphate dehydrogenase [Amycolatopsis japonica]KFZ78866.1 F420-dependent oxidoreductase [Amycolatopsis sp. MJM2582]OKJ96398.1 F420-dependent oxidoreductase [Amycolatopsis sp. CB00013]OLZ58280.1 glucose-6-phosphate dehydrogenase (coenzyme-F420) [Amycolatopsis keratiniphila subsp. nogabecina]ONF69929.1 glucose-6-phosphate dehydrogenase (coenzyme-F420) [Amycolatopsis keratiniphil